MQRPAKKKDWAAKELQGASLAGAVGVSVRGKWVWGEGGRNGTWRGGGDEAAAVRWGQIVKGLHVLTIVIKN